MTIVAAVGLCIWQDGPLLLFAELYAHPNSPVLGAECRVAGTIWLGQRPIIQTPWRVFLYVDAHPVSKQTQSLPREFLDRRKQARQTWLFSTSTTSLEEIFHVVDTNIFVHRITDRMSVTYVDSCGSLSGLPGCRIHTRASSALDFRQCESPCWSLPRFRLAAIVLLNANGA